MSNIDDLPAIDIWPLIFRNLSINDLFNCRSVNKKFKNFSDHSDGIYRLIVGKLYIGETYWSYNKELAEKEESITFKCFQKIRSLNLFNLNQNLKYLIIKVNNDNKFDLEELSSFINLENLKIEISKFDKDKNLNLENLTFFDFYTSELDFKINLNTPKLKMIKYDNYWNYESPYPYNYIDFVRRVKVSNPESIKHLIIHRYENELKIFKRLEILELHSLKGIDSDVLNCFTKLRKIKFEFKSYNIDTIENLLNYIKNLQRDILIYYLDVKIENINKVIEYEHGSILIYQVKNYNHLDSNLSTITTGLNYNQLEHSFCDLQINLPASFFDKFVYLHKIYVYDNVNNFDDLNSFLQNLKNLRELYLYDRSLDQNFYDNLPNTIRTLDIRSNENIEDCDFILKLTELTDFSISKNIDLFDLALKSFSNLKDLRKFEFYFNRKRVEITKFKGEFNLVIDYKLKKKEINYEQLVNFIDAIRLEI